MNLVYIFFIIFQDFIKLEKIINENIKKVHKSGDNQNLSPKMELNESETTWEKK